MKTRTEQPTLLLPLLVGKDVTEIGARHGDDLACYAHAAKSIKVYEIVPEYCRKTSERLGRACNATGCRAQVECRDYKSTSAGKHADFDVITWWQHRPHLVDDAVLHHYKLLGSRHRLRAGAIAVSLHDAKNPDDVSSLNRLRPQAAWHVAVAFDERARCCSRYTPPRPADCAARASLTRVSPLVACDRAYGVFHVLGYDLTA